MRCAHGAAIAWIENASRCQKYRTRSLERSRSARCDAILQRLGVIGDVDERQLLNVDVALLRQSRGDRRLADEPLIREVLAGGDHAAHTVSAREERLDLAGRARLADVPQVLEHGGEERAR